MDPSGLQKKHTHFFGCPNTERYMKKQDQVIMTRKWHNNSSNTAHDVRTQPNKQSNKHQHQLVTVWFVCLYR